MNPYNLPFEEAIAYFSQKVLVPGAEWGDILDGANNHAFFVSQVTSAQLLQDMFDEVKKFISEGKTFEEFNKNFTAIAEKHGWEAREGIARRAQVVADANLRTAQAAGRYQQMMDPYVLKRRPYWEYRHRDSPKFRPHHKALNGKVFSAVDVQQNPALAVPSGFGCRCALFAVRSLPDGQTEPDPIPKVGGKVAMVIDGKVMPIADKGWDYMPGNKGAIADELLAKLRPELRQNIAYPESP